MKKLLILLLLILCVGCAKSQYQDIYKDDILRAQYQGGWNAGYLQGYRDCTGSNLKSWENIIKKENENELQ